MKTLKRIALMALYLLLTIISLPFIVLMFIGALVVYGTFKAESSIVCDIWDDELTEEWNQMVNAFAMMMDNLKELFVMEMELV